MDHRMMQLRRSLDCMTKSGKNFRVLDLYLCSRTNSGSFMVDKLTISGVVFYFNSVFAGDGGGQSNVIKNYTMMLTS